MVDSFARSAQVLANLPTNAIAENFPRFGPVYSSQSVLTSARLHVVRMGIPTGRKVSTITFVSGGTGATNPTHQVFCIYDSALALLGQTADDTTTAWGTNTPKTLTLASAVTATGGSYYVGLWVVADTPPTLLGVNGGVINNIAPITNGFSTTSLVATAPDPAAALTFLGPAPYCYVS